MQTCILAAFLLTACQALTPPRLATATARAVQPATPSPEPLVLTAPTPTAVSGAAISAPSEATPQVEPNPVISVWVNETSAAHEEALTNTAAEFTAAEQVDVELMLVSPMLLPDLVNTAVLSDTLPDLILHPIEYSLGWADRGILDAGAADTAVDQIGRDTFNPNALTLLENSNGQMVAIPSDGYYQLVIYRQDWFNQRNLATPDTYDAMLAAAEATTERENFTSGFVIPTEANLVTTHQAFEHLALANDCQLIDEKGEVLLLAPACVEALNFYFSIVNQYSPIGVQTDTSTRNAYLAGRTGLIMGPPSLLPLMAGLNSENPPVCPQCADNPAFLAENSGVLTEISGQGSQAQPASFGEIMALGITTAANTEAAAFADYWFNEGYAQWLAVEPERKVPMRWGTNTDPRRYIDNWGDQPIAGSDLSLQNIYGEELVTRLRDGVAASPRWGLPHGQGPLITKLYEELTFSIVLQEMLSGYFGPDQTIIELFNRVIEFIPNYPYDLPEPTVTPDN